MTAATWVLGCKTIDFYKKINTEYQMESQENQTHTSYN